MSGFVIRLDGLQFLSAVAKVSIGIVLQDDDVVLAAQLRQLLPPLLRQGPAGRVLEGGDHIDHLRVILPDFLLDVLQDESLIVHLAADAFSLEHLEDLHALHKGGGLAENDVARVYKDLAYQVHGLDSAVDDKNIVGIGGNPFRSQQFPGDDLPQLLHARNRTILQGLRAAFFTEQHLACDPLDRLHRQSVRCRRTAAEGDDLGVAHRAEEGTHHPRGSFHVLQSFCELRHR